MPRGLSALLPAGSKPIPDELRLVLYALHQQATVGPCSETKPWGWNVVESAKWESWNQLANMSSVEAMRLYVKMVEDDQVSQTVLVHLALRSIPADHFEDMLSAVQRQGARLLTRPCIHAICGTTFIDIASAKLRATLSSSCEQ